MNDTFNGADVQSKEKLVLPDKFLVSLDIAGFADNNRLRE